MPLGTDLPTSKIDGDTGHTAGHNATNTRANEIATEINAQVAARRVVYLTAPPVGSGLSAIAANGSTNDRAAIQAALDYVDSTWGAGTVIGPVGTTVKCNSGITIPTKVQLRDLTLDCTSMSTGPAITVNDTDSVPLYNVKVTGPGDGSSVDCLDVTGVGLRFERLEIREFRRNVDLANENTYINTFIQCAIGEANVCVYQDLSAVGATNSGEKTVFRDCTFFNSTQVLQVTNNQGGMFLDGCSLDYSALMGYVSSSHVFFDSCHVESNFVTTPNGYFFEPAFEARLSFNGCNFMMGSTGGEGLRFIIKPTTGPSVYTKGRVTYSGCMAYFVDTSSTGRQRFDDELQFIEQTATTVVFETPFVSKWGPVSVNVAANDGDIYREVNVAPTIDRDGSGYITGEITVTASAAPGSGNYLPVRIKF